MTPVGKLSADQSEGSSADGRKSQR